MRMQTAILAAAVPLLLFGSPATAQFEGVIESKMTSASAAQAGATGNITSVTYVGKAGARMEMTIASPQGTIKMTTLQQRSRPGILLTINDARKSYSEIDTEKLAEQVAERTPETYSVKRHGKENVRGHDCEHATVTTSKGDEWDMWVTKEFGSSEAFWASQRRGRRGTEGFGKALKQEGLDGWPMKMVIKSKDSEAAMTWEVTKVEKKSVSQAMFEVPAGYTKSEDTGMLGMAGQMQLPPEQQKKLDEAMKQQQEALKNMTPEQRKQYEEMMKALGGTGQQKKQ